jgi:LysM repeat protein
MKDNLELQLGDALSDESSSSPNRRRIGSGNSKSIGILLGILLVLIFAGGIFYFLSKRPTGDEVSPLQSKVTALEQKNAELEKQLGELQGKIGTITPDSDLIRRVETLAQKVEALEKQKQPTAESKAKPSAPSKPAVSTEKQYHAVQKGETLYRISKKYGISVEELRKLNNLSEDQSIYTGQKLRISP